MVDVVVARIRQILPVTKKQVPKETATLERKSKRLIAQDGWSPPSFDTSCVRLVLYQDHEGRGKKQVFDTKAQLGATNATDINDSNVYTGRRPSLSSSLTHSLRTNNNDDNNIHDSLGSSVTSSLGNSYRSKFNPRRQSSDSELLGEMMFGSMPMKLMGNSVKIHYIRSEEQLMVTKVFFAQKRMMSSCSLNDFTDSCPLPSNDQPGMIPKHQNSFHYSLRPPSSSPDSMPRQSFSQSYLSPGHSPTTSLPLSLANSGNHDNSPTQSLNVGVPSSLTSSLSRRLQRVRSTSLENGSELYYRILKPMDQSTSIRRGRKYAVGVIFSLNEMKPAERQQFQDFFFSHFNLISSSLEQLREKIEEALWSRRQVLAEIVTKAYTNFVDNFKLLYCAQRIKAPIWLEIVGESCNKRETCYRFLTELKSLMNQLETKDSRFFLSSLLTAVLSYHLAWVYTVSKSGSAASYRHHDRTTSKSLAVLAETHPYNPLWAQFGDLCGAVSDPLTVCRTIVVGKSSSLVCRLLYLLTYFIRCSEIEEQGGGIKDSTNHFDELEESDIFPQGSRTGSALTLLSESGRSSGPGLITSNSLERVEVAPLVKPHPFSFTRGNSYTSSYSGSVPELNSNSMHLSCTSLDGLVATPRAPQRGLPIPNRVNDSTTGVCQSVPTTGMTSNRTYHGNFTHDGPYTGNNGLYTELDRPYAGNSRLYNGLDSSNGRPYAGNFTGVVSNNNNEAYFRPKVQEESTEGGLMMPFLSHNTHNIGIVTNNTTSTGRISSNPSYSTNGMGMCPTDGIGMCPTDGIGMCPSQPDSMGTCPIDTHRIIWRPGERQQHILMDSPSSPPEGPPGTFTNGSWKKTPNNGTNNNSCLLPDEKSLQQKQLLQSESSTDSLSTGYQTISRNLSGTSLGGTSSVVQGQFKAGLPPRRQGTCSSFDSGVFEHTSILTNDSERLAMGDVDSLSASGGYSISRFNNKALNNNPELSLRALSSESRNNRFIRGEGSQLRGAHHSLIETHALSHDQLHLQNRHEDNHSSHLSPTSSHHTTSNDDRFSHSYNNGTNYYNHSSYWSTDPTSNTTTNRLTDSVPININNTCDIPSVVNVPVIDAKCDSSPVLSSMEKSIDCVSIPRNSSYKGLPVVEGLCPEYGQCKASNNNALLGVEQINVEESLSARSLSYLSTSPFNSLPERGGEREGGKMIDRQFKDFAHIEINTLDEDLGPDLILSPLTSLPNHHHHSSRPSSHPPSSNSTPHMSHICRTPPTPSLATPSYNGSLGGGVASSDYNDFGHSLMAGYSPVYMPHFVLHGTSQPFVEFKDQLINDLSTMIKYSIIDEPVQHGVAIVADTDSLTCRIVAVSKTKRANDGEVIVGASKSAHSIQQLLHSVCSLWDMQLPPEFCLSSMEDGLMALNERGQMISTGLLEQGHIGDLSRSLQKLHSSLNTNISDEPLLAALAGVHASSTNTNLSKELQLLFLHSSLVK